MGMHMTRAFAVGIAVISVLLIFQSPVAKAQEDMTTTEFRAEFPGQEIPGSLETVNNNIADPSNVSTEISKWEEDIGKENTKGSYMGPLFESSIFEVDYEPYRSTDTYSTVYTYYDDINQSFPYNYLNYGNAILEQREIDSSFTYYDRLSVLTVTSIMQFPNRVIMSGATEFWLKVPVVPSCIDFVVTKPSISIFKTDEDNTTIQNSLQNNELVCKPLFDVIYDPAPYKFELYPNGSAYDVEQPIGSIREDLNSGRLLQSTYKGNYPYILQPITSDSVINDRIYLKIFGVIEPNTNYLFVFNGVLKDKPKLLVTEEDVCSNGRYCSIDTTDVPFIISSDTHYDFSAKDYIHEVKEVVADTSQEPYTSAHLDMPIDLSFSTIFLQGRGFGGMFGHKLHFEKDEGFIFYNTFDTPNTDKYISVMIPFICDKQVEVNITVFLLTPNVKFEPQALVPWWSMNTTVYKNPNFWQAPKNMSYTDYILFTTPRKIQALPSLYGPEITVKVLVTFTEPVDITLMFSTLSASEITDTVYDISPSLRDYEIRPDLLTSWHSPIFQRKNLFYVYRNIQNMGVIEFTTPHKDDFKNGVVFGGFNWLYRTYEVRKTPRILTDAEIYHYSLFRSVQLTDGIWHELAKTSSGEQYATHFFERRVSVGLIELWIDTSNNESHEQKAWYDDTLQEWGMALESLEALDIVGAVYHAVSGAISLIWNGLKTLVGAILGVFHKVYDALVGIGKFLVSVITSFVGTVISIMGDIADGLVDIIEVSLYIIAVIIFMWLIGEAGKLIYVNKLTI